MLRIRKALISVWDKKGIVDFARKLRHYNVEIISTGKTALLLRKKGVPVREVSSLTAFPEILSGRVKTLHPKIFGAILANKKHPLHLEEIKNLNIEPIDLVAVNFYPFGEMKDEHISFDQKMEYIDIGGPTLLRASAKNFKNVACVSNPWQYKRISDELEAQNGMISEETLRELACEVFRLTKNYDSGIYSYLKGSEIVSWDFEGVMKLRYGENPHQKAGLYKLLESECAGFTQIQGKQISFNNLLDIDSALAVVRQFQDPAAAVIKHLSPCGVAVDKNIHRAYAKAYGVDPLSSFGGIVGLNRKVDRKTAHEILKSGFKECIIAPSYSKESLRMFAQKKNLRVVEGEYQKRSCGKDVKRTSFGYLIQDCDTRELTKNDLKIVTTKKPTEREMRDLIFAWKVVKQVKSNAIVIARNMVTLGIGAGQPSRVDAVRIAIKKSLKTIQGACVASEAFFPKKDALKLIKKYGIKAVIQPGGSIMDEQIIEFCNKQNIAMVFTGIRHFRH